MLRRLFQKLTNPYVKSEQKTKNKVLLFLLTVFCFGCVFGLNQINTYGQHVRGVEGAAIVPGTKSGNASIWPVTHPVFVVQLEILGERQGTGTDDYYYFSQKYAGYIPYASKDAMWMCSNDLSAYLIRQGFHTPAQTYVLRKSSNIGKKLYNSGGENNAETIGRIKYLSNYETKTFSNDIKNGVFYKKVLDLYIKNNRSMTALLKDSSFLSLLNSPSKNDYVILITLSILSQQRFGLITE